MFAKCAWDELAHGVSYHGDNTIVSSPVDECATSVQQTHAPSLSHLHEITKVTF